MGLVSKFARLFTKLNEGNESEEAEADHHEEASAEKQRVLRANDRGFNMAFGYAVTSHYLTGISEYNGVV